MHHVYSKHGATLRPIDPEAINVQQLLPVGTYNVGMDERGWFLTKIEDFDLPSKLYGDVDQRADRILRTFNDRPNSTGVLLSGNSGAGKTMLAKRVSQLAMRQGYPTLVINVPFCGEDFNTLLQKIGQPVVVIFDEFEKVYDRDKQKQLLTIFDGTYVQKKLFIITCNDRWRIDEYMHNRPGRIFYSIDYGSLPTDFISDYCDDNLTDKSQKAGVLNVSTFFTSFSFDMLKSLVEEMNRYGETAGEAMRVLNMKPHHESKSLHDVSFLWHGEKPEFPDWTDDEDLVDANPLALNSWGHHLNAWPERGATVEVKGKRVPIPDGALRGSHFVTLDPSKLVRTSSKDGVFIFDTKVPGLQIQFKRRPAKQYAYNYDAR